MARALRILELVAAAAEIGVRDLALQAGMTRSTVHRLLTSLHELGYVEQTAARGRYRLTLRLYSLGCQAGALASLRQAARPAMEHLAAVTNESVNLGMLEGSQVVYVDRIESSHTLRTVVHLGARVPFHLSSIGKVIAAHLPPAQLASVLGEEPLAASTARTLTDPTRLREHLAAVRQQGYATNIDEHETNISAVAAPVFDFDGRLVAGLSVSAPSVRLKVEGLAPLAQQVTDAAREVSLRLGRSTRTGRDRQP